MTRRALLLGGAGAALLAACGDGGDKTSASTPVGYSLVQFFDGSVLAPGEPGRVTFGLGDREGLLSTGAPATLEIDVRRDDRPVDGAPKVVRRHQGALPRPYYPLIFTPPAPGTYTVSARVRGERASSTFEIPAASEVTVLRPGQQLPALETPTMADHRGVDPVCTRDPVCPLHDVTLAEALTEGRPVAFLVSTPKYCQVAICGPVLDILLDARADYGDRVRMLHAEVYTDASIKTTTPAVQQTGLPLEPSLFVARPDGAIAVRLDSIFDGVELRSALDRALA
jgi:hypothetical protein